MITQDKKMFLIFGVLAVGMILFLIIYGSTPTTDWQGFQ